MKSFLVGEIRKIINGTLIKGTDDLIITDVSYYIQNMSKINCLLFPRMRWKIKWYELSEKVPCAVVIDRNYEELSAIEGCTVILVEDIEKAYWTFVEFYRNLFDIPVITVTGTCGKTTTKEMIRHILNYSCKVQGTRLSANGRTVNLAYLLGIDDSTGAAVFETPVGQPGDLENSCKYFKPDIGIITNIGIDHLKGCKTMEAYIEAKAGMLTGVGEHGVLIINADDDNIRKINMENYKGRIVRFGVYNPCDFQASNIEYCENGMNFTVKFRKMKYNIFVPGYGEHQVYNALGAFASVHELGIGVDESAERLRNFENLPLHLQLIPGIKDCTILDDSWNTNPLSLQAAFRVLNSISKGRKRGALIADITALGKSEEEIHRNVGDIIIDSGGVDFLITVGPLASETARRISERSPECEVHQFTSVDGVYELVTNMLDKDTILLIKYPGYHVPDLMNLKQRLKASVN